MRRETRLRINVNSQALIKLAGILSNSTILASNVYLLSEDVRRRIKEKKTEVAANRLQLTAEIANAVASLAKVAVNALERK